MMALWRSFEFYGHDWYDTSTGKSLPITHLQKNLKLKMVERGGCRHSRYDVGED